MICDDIARREDVLKHPTLNGIDYVEVPKDDQQNIRVYFIKPTPPSLAINEVWVEGGVRIHKIRVKNLQPKNDASSHPYLEVHVDRAGDFSTYTLVIDSSEKMDQAFSRYPFNFKAGCPSDFDCHKKLVCPTAAKEEPIIDYMAKDYASFRRALIDLIPTLVPDWKERHEADMGIALVELLAYVGDQLSYYQDAAANEAYLETARQRESVKRHARLIDYTMHDGANARTFIYFKIKEGTTVTIPELTHVVILSRIDVPLGPNFMPPHGTVIANTVGKQALSAADTVFEFETEQEETITLHAKLNEIRIHTWGNRLCCVPQGTTTLHLMGDLPLNKGDLLLFEEVKGPKTGLSADANPRHRQVVRLIEVNEQPITDPLQKDPNGNPLKLTQVTWHRSDALTFPLCISSQHKDGTFINDVSVARGNLILADHGQTIEEWYPANPTADPEAPGIEKRNIAYRFELKNGPMTFHTPKSSDDEEKTPVQAMLKVDPRKTQAHASLELYEDGSTWELVPHLLDSKPFDRDFVVESENTGKALIRFGDGTYGMEPPQGAHIQVTYRVGNGTAGNAGSDTLVHVVQPLNPGSINWFDIAEVRNPLPAWGGIEPETLDQVKLLAPKAFHAEQFRAVTEDDYARAAERHSEVDRAVATFRWTGSWHTVFVAIDPLGRADLASRLAEDVRKHLLRYKLAGYDIEIDPPLYVPLEIEITVCVALDHFRAHVKEALLNALSNREFPDGTRGFFHPDNFTFGQAVYLSKLYNTLEHVDGVDSTEVTLFKRLGKLQNNELDQGYISMGRLEIARLDNDPNFPENGVLRLNMMGGK